MTPKSIRFDDDLPNYHKISNQGLLPKFQACIVNIGVETEHDARQYAALTGREIYWIETLGLAVWVSPARRVDDLRVRTLA